MRKQRWITAAFLVPVAIGIYTVVGAQIVKVSFHHDFLSFYTAATFAREGRLDALYNLDTVKSFQQTIAPEKTEVVPVIRPRFYSTVLMPLAFVPYKVAFWCWIAFQTVVLLACWLWIGRTFGPDALVAAAFFFPAATAIAHGQDASLFLAFHIGSYAAMERRRETLAGLVLGVMLFKFHLLLLFPFAMVVQRRWKMLRGFAFVGATLGLIELALAGPAGILAYFKYLTRTDITFLNAGAQNMLNLGSLLLNLGVDSIAVRNLLALLVVALTVHIFRASKDWWVVTSAASLAAVCIVPHTYQYDLTWCLLPLFCILYKQKEIAPRILAATLLTPFPYLLTLVGIPWAGAAAICILGLILAIGRQAVAILHPFGRNSTSKKHSDTLSFPIVPR